MDPYQYGWFGFVPKAGRQYEIEINRAQEMWPVDPNQKMESKRFVDLFVSARVGSARQYSFVFKSTSEQFYEIDDGQRVPITFSQSKGDRPTRIYGFPIDELAQSYAVVTRNESGDFDYWPGVDKAFGAPNILETAERTIDQDSIKEVSASGNENYDPLDTIPACESV